MKIKGGIQIQNGQQNVNINITDKNTDTERALRLQETTGRLSPSTQEKERRG